MADFTITLRDLEYADACDLDKRLDDIAEAIGHAPGEDEPIQLTVWWALPSMSAEDRVRGLCAVEPYAKALPLVVAFAESCAKRAAAPGAYAASRAAARAAAYANICAYDATCAAAADAADAAADAAAVVAADASACAGAAYDAERDAQARDLERLFLGVDVEEVPRG